LLVAVVLLTYAASGELLTEIFYPAVRSKSGVFDLHVTGNTLIVSRFGWFTSEVLFYQMN